MYLYILRLFSTTQHQNTRSAWVPNIYVANSHVHVSQEFVITCQVLRTLVYLLIETIL